MSDQVSTVNIHSPALRSGYSQKLETTHSLSSLFIETSPLQILNWSLFFFKKNYLMFMFLFISVKMSMENFTCTGGVRAGRGTSWASLQNLLIPEDSAPGGPGQKLSSPPQESQDTGREGEVREDSAAPLEQAGSAQPASSSSGWNSFSR